MSLLDKKIEDYFTDNSTVVFECDEFDKYRYPNEEEVPADWYYSMIVGVRNSKTSNGQDCIDVFHKLLTQREIYRYEHEEIDCVSYLYIKQRYKRRSESEGNFKTAMKKYGLPRNFTGNDLVGIIEGVKIEYSKSGWGNIVKRDANTISSDWFYDDVDEEHNDETDDEVEADEERCADSSEDIEDEDYYEDFDFSDFDD